MNVNQRGWQPSATSDALVRRSDITGRIRDFFRANGLHEVHTPTISRDTVVDRHIDPINISGDSLGLSSEDPSEQFFLQTSPEFCMKRLLAAGMNAIYQIGPAFRAGELGSHHNPEFTMVEWYRVGDDMRAGVDLLSDLVQVALDFGRPQELTYQDAFLATTGIDPLTCDLPALSNAARVHKVAVTENWSTDTDDWLNLLFSELVQPRLGNGAPTILTHYPASQSALARISDDDPRAAERFELFIQGIELANGYHELLDAPELERRNTDTNAQRVRDGNQPLPSDSQLLAAMHDGLPSCSGCALGLDRLLMVDQNTNQIADVMAFPIYLA